MRHLPFYGRWFRFLMFYPASGLSIERNRVDPDWDDDGRSISAGNAQTRELFGAWIASQLEDRPDLLETSIPHYPPSAKRMLQDNGSWLTCLKKPNVELVRTGIERIVPDGIVTVDGELHEADVICYATGFRHNDFLAPMEFDRPRRCLAARAVGRTSPRPTSASRSPTSRTCSASTAPAPTSPTAPA